MMRNFFEPVLSPWRASLPSGRAGIHRVRPQPQRHHRVSHAATHGGHAHMPSLRERVGFACINFVFTALTNIFAMYYMELFVHRYHATDSQFYTAQIIFLVWNSCNDFVFAYVTDLLRGSKNPVVRKIDGLLYAGIGWCMISLLPWFSWPHWLTGVHLTLCLCLVDGFSSYTQQACNALMIDLTTSDSARAILVQYSSAGSIAGSIPLFIIQLSTVSHITEPGAMETVRIVVLAMCAVSGVSTFIAFRSFAATRAWYESTGQHIDVHELHALNASSRNDDDDDDDDDVETGRHTSGPDASSSSSSSIDGSNDSTARRVSATQGEGSDMELELEEDREGLWSDQDSLMTIIRHIMTKTSFLIVSLTHFLQITVCSFNTSMFHEFVGTYVPKKSIAHTARALLSPISIALPFVFVMIISGHITKHGVHETIKRTIMCRVIMYALAMYISYTTGLSSSFWGVFLVMNRAITELTCVHTSLALGEVVDEHQYVTQRRQPLSSIIYGLDAVIARPGQSLGPILGLAWIRWRRKGSGRLAAPNTVVPGSLTTGSGSGSEVWVLPALLTLTQLFLWFRVPLRGEYLEEIKQGADCINTKVMNVGGSRQGADFGSSHTRRTDFQEDSHSDDGRGRRNC